MNFKTDIAKKYNRKIYTLNDVWKLKETVRYVPTSKKLSDSQCRDKCKRLRLKSSRYGRIQ